MTVVKWLDDIEDNGSCLFAELLTEHARVNAYAEAAQALELQLMELGTRLYCCMFLVRAFTDGPEQRLCMDFDMKGSSYEQRSEEGVIRVTFFWVDPGGDRGPELVHEFREWRPRKTKEQT